MYKKLRESDQFHGKIDEDEYIYVIEQLSKIFPGENLIEDLKLIGDSVVKKYCLIKQNFKRDFNE